MMPSKRRFPLVLAIVAALLLAPQFAFAASTDEGAGFDSSPNASTLASQGLMAATVNTQGSVTAGSDSSSVATTQKATSTKKAKALSKKAKAKAKAKKRFANRLKRAKKKARGMRSYTRYLITVDVTNHWLCVFKGKKGHWRLIDNWKISNGRKSSPTPTGTYTVGIKGYSFGHGYTCYYYTQFLGDYLFHSVLYHQGTFRVKDGRLGRYVSAGCVRMPLKRAKWIYDHIPGGTRVRIYK